MNPETYAQIALLGLRILDRIMEDIPRERRAEMWNRWFDFTDRIEGRKPKNESLEQSSDGDAQNKDTNDQQQIRKRRRR